MRRVLGWAVLTLWSAIALGDQTSDQLKSRQAQAQQQRVELQSRIGELQKTIERQSRSRHDALTQLKASESAISEASRRLLELSKETQSVQADLTRLAQDITDTGQQADTQRRGLAEQLRAQYAGGLSPWTALLSGNDPQRIGRDLAYSGYVSRAHADAVRDLQASLVQLDDLEGRLQQHEVSLETLHEETARRKHELEQQKEKRAAVLAQVEIELKKRRSEAQTLEQDAQRIEGLVQGLQKAIQAQEAAQRRERERLAAERAQREKEAQARAEREQTEREARTLEAERSRDTGQERTPAAEAMPTLAGLDKGLPAPVKGQVLGRFGAERPDGGVWRGIVLRAQEGTPVRPVAPGRVVYANWLNGFGNLLIVDHGENYLSIYAYNQSLLRHVGDRVGPQDTIARVGATGGQVEPGLYFEIRHNGTPVNPLIWLAH